MDYPSNRGKQHMLSRNDLMADMDLVIGKGYGTAEFLVTCSAGG